MQKKIKRLNPKNIVLNLITSKRKQNSYVLEFFFCNRIKTFRVEVMGVYNVVCGFGLVL